MKRFLIKGLILLLTCPLFAQSQIKFTTSNLNLREDPWIGDNIICVIPKASTLAIDYSKQEYTDWIRITYSGHLGYVYSKYLINLHHENENAKSFESLNGTSSLKYYTNSQGVKVQSPTYYKAQPAGASAICRDGTYSFSKSRRGTCSHHGGVARWL